jgi:hypothetical protein
MQLGRVDSHLRVLSSCLRLGLLPLLCVALLGCSGQQDETSPDSSREVVPASAASVDPSTYASIFADEASWPVRVWLEEPLLDESGEVLVPVRRMGVLMYLSEDGRARVDFGRFGPHTVPASQTNLVDEARRIRSGEASKPLPNLIAMLATRLVDSTSEKLAIRDAAWDGPRDERVLLVFADPFAVDMREIQQQLSPVESSAMLWQTVLVPISDQDDAALLVELRAQGWESPFVVNSVARSYVPAMLAPQTPRPLLRLSSANGRILIEGPPTEATVAAIAAALDAPQD